jgi:type IV pilus assembly protein PilP
MTQLSQTLSGCLILLALLFLSGCGDNSIRDLEKYVAKIKASPNGFIPTFPEFKHIPPYFYEVQHLRDPFKPLEEPEYPDSNDTKRPGNRTETQPKSCPPLKPHWVPTGLELISLDVLKMTGTVEMNGTLWALVKLSSESTVYQVKKGDHLGEHYGKIIKISERKIDILEQIPDEKRCWKPRVTSINWFN